MKTAIDIGPASEDELASAFALAFQHERKAHRRRRIDNALALVLSGSFPREGVRVLRVGPRRYLAGIFPCQLLAGNNGQVWIPAFHPRRTNPEWQNALIQEGLAWLRSQQARFVHALVAPPDYQRAQPLLDHGFRPVTEIALWQRSLDTLPDIPCLPEVRLESYTAEQHERFCRTLERTFEDSLDVPELNGRRSADEILEGHQSEGRFFAPAWRMALVGDEPVGLVLMIQDRALGGWELSYLGVVPAWRRQGLARWMVGEALLMARNLQAEQLTVSVDCRNDPALQLYASLGFREWERHHVFLHFFEVPSS